MIAQSASQDAMNPMTAEINMHSMPMSNQLTSNGELNINASSVVSTRTLHNWKSPKMQWSWILGRRGEEPRSVHHLQSTIYWLKPEYLFRYNKNQKCRTFFVNAMPNHLHLPTGTKRKRLEETQCRAKSWKTEIDCNANWSTYLQIYISCQLEKPFKWHSTCTSTLHSNTRFCFICLSVFAYSFSSSTSQRFEGKSQRGKERDGGREKHVLLFNHSTTQKSKCYRFRSHHYAFYFRLISFDAHVICIKML